MKTALLKCAHLTACVLVTSLMAGCNKSTESPPVARGDDADLSVLQQQLQTLQARAEQVKDANAIKKLQRTYGYYLSAGQWQELANLFAEDATLEIARDGVYKGKSRIAEYFNVLGKGQNGLVQGQLNEHLLVMPVVTLGQDGKTAKGRWRDIILQGQLGQHAEWGEGPYENEYIKDNGVWKFSKVKWQQAILVNYQGGWAKNEDYNKGIWVSDKLPPDAPPTDDKGSWPEVWLLPFHFNNPVGTYVPPAAPVQSNPATPTGAKP